ncbi:MAG: hypothetical protein EKK47_02935 [Burkholderiales bacterium]|jgi:hypothetical protein|nr:MAG: hypothetical protein EKK47_02935 [Burkholderiales bacterium]
MINSKRRFINGALVGSLLSGTGAFCPMNLFAADRKKGVGGPLLGVNCFDLFYAPLGRHPNVRSPQARIQELADHGIPFIRFAASPFWPNEWAKGLGDKDRFARILDDIMEEATKRKVGLIPSLFWYPAAVNYWKGERLAAWGDPKSATMQFMREHTAWIVSRYKQSSPVLCWEFGNEFSSHADWPDAVKWWPKLNPAQGTPTERTDDDRLTTAMVFTAEQQFLAAVKAADPNARTTTGNDFPRSDAFSGAKRRKGLDQPQDLVSSIESLTPPGYDLASVHLYPDRRKARFGQDYINYKQLLAPINQYFEKRNQSWFIGEFGVPQSGDQDRDQAEFKELLEAVMQTNAKYAALWVYDFKPQERQWSVTFDGPMAYQLQAIMAANSSRQASR